MDHLCQKDPSDISSLLSGIKKIKIFGVEEKIKINHGTKLFVFFDQIYIQDDIFDHDLLFIQLAMGRQQQYVKI